MPELHLDEFIQANPALNLKAGTIRKWLALWGDKPQNGILSECQQSLILSYIENVSGGGMSQADFVQRVKQAQLHEQADQYQADQFQLFEQFLSAERQVRQGDGFQLGDALSEDFMSAIDAGFAAGLAKRWNDRMCNEKSPYRLANQLIHAKLQELRAADAQKFSQRLKAVPFAVDPAGLLGAADDD